MQTITEFRTPESGLPQVVVNADQFREKAALAGWLMRNVELFLREPRLCKFIRVGDEMLLVK